MKLEDLDFNSLLPHWMRDDESNISLAAGLSALLIARNSTVENSSFYDAINSLPENMLDALAQLLQIDWYMTGWTLENKRECLLNSDLIRDRAGTKWALEKAVQIWLQDPTAYVEEWFDYHAPYYTFRIFTQNNDFAVISNRESFSTLIKNIKRASQNMDGVFAGFSMKGTMYAGATGGEGSGNDGKSKFLPYLDSYSTVIDDIDELKDYMYLLNPDLSQTTISNYIDNIWDDVNEEFTDTCFLSINSDGTPRFIDYDNYRAWTDAQDAVEEGSIAPGFSSGYPLITYTWPFNSLRNNIGFFTNFCDLNNAASDTPWIQTTACPNVTASKSGSYAYTKINDYNYAIECTSHPAGYRFFQITTGITGNTITRNVNFNVNIKESALPNSGEYWILCRAGGCTLTNINQNRNIFIGINSDGHMVIFAYYNTVYYVLGEGSTVIPLNTWTNINYKCVNGSLYLHVNGISDINTPAANSNVGAHSGSSYFGILTGGATSTQFGGNAYVPKCQIANVGLWINSQIIGNSYNMQCLASGMPPWSFLPIS